MQEQEQEKVSKEYNLNITTRFPMKYRLVDLQTGQVWMFNLEHLDSPDQFIWKLDENSPISIDKDYDQNK